MRKRIVILSLSVGSGHVRAAQVVQRALTDGGEDLEILNLDVLAHAHRWFHWVYVDPYWVMLRRFPGVWKSLFERRQEKQHRATAPHWIFRRGCSAVFKRLKEFAPHQVIATEIGAAEIAALAKREGIVNAPVLAVQTDYYTEPPWVQREIDVYCVGSDEARRQLVGWGISPNRVLVCGVPIDTAFSLAFDRAELVKALGLDPRRPLVLVMGGGMGPVPLHRVVESLELCRLPLQVLAVAGHEQHVKAMLDALKGKLTLDLRTYGWTEDIPELMAAADILITKPGGVSSAEALCAGLPMILTHPIPGQEERHVEYLTRHGAAVLARGLAEIPELTTALLTDKARRDEMIRSAREIARPDAAHGVAQVARALLEKASYIDLLATPPERPGESAFLM
jgi:processive 1,2-diacylglycerol beta-glucosyltransferase